MKRIPIKERLILYFVLLGLVSIAIISLFSIFEAKKGIRERVFSQLILLRDLRKEQIQTFYHTRSQELMALANSKNIRENISDLLEIPGNSLHQRSFRGENSILDLVTDRNQFKSLYIITRDHSYYKIEKKSGEFQIEPDSSFKASVDISSLFSQDFKENTFFVKEKINENSEYHLLIIVPVVIKEEGCLALLVSELNPEALQNLIYDKNPGSGMGRTGEAYLAGADGFMRSPSRFLNDAIMKIKVNTAGFEKALSGKEGTGIYYDYRGIEILGAYGLLEIGGLKQVILAEIDVSEAMVPLNIIRTDILMVSAIILMAIFIVTWVVAHGITRPLIKLKNAANFISAGNYSQNLEIESDDEIGELTGAFNTMSEALANERVHRIRAVFDGKDAEQQRLSRELHDGLGQQLAAAKMMLESSLYDDGEKLKSRIIEAQAIFDQIIGEIRRISHDLSPSILTEFGLKAAAENLCRNICKATGIAINLSYEPEGLQPDELTSAYLYRIMQECLNNIQSHSGASQVGISLMADQDSLYLEIGDNGKGFDMKNVSGTTGTGLYNMRERVHILKGEIKIMSSLGKGTKIRFRIPYLIEK